MHNSSDWTVFADDRKAFVHRWLPDQAPRAIVCVVHGLGEHAGRYDALAQRLVRRGLGVVAFDQQGHGQSPLERGCIDSYDSLLNDVSLFCAWAETEFADQPRVLLGHSMGGNIVLNHLMRKSSNYCGVISSSPMIRSPREPGWLKEMLVRCMLKVNPNYQLQSEVDPTRVMSDPVEQESFLADDVFHNRLSLRLGAALIDSGRWLLKNATSVSKPLLLSHADNDQLTCHKSSIEFAKSAGSNCELRIWPGMMHDPFRGLEKETVIDTFVEFVDRVCEAPVAR